MLYIQDIEKGLYGKPAKFWIQYMYLIHLYHNFTRSVRTGDLDLHISWLPKITNIFFVMNRKWMVWNQANCKIFLQYSNRPNSRADHQRRCLQLAFWNYFNDQLNFGKTTLGGVSFFSNYYYIIIVRYARHEEKRLCAAISPTWSYGER